MVHCRVNYPSMEASPSVQERRPRDKFHRCATAANPSAPQHDHCNQNTSILIELYDTVYHSQLTSDCHRWSKVNCRILLPAQTVFVLDHCQIV